jgi:anti-sigma B factor antagonist
MQIESQMTKNVAVLELAGRFDAYTAPEVTTLLERSAAPPRVVVDLRGVSFIDSTALAVLVRGMKQCRQRDGDLHLCGLQQPVRIIFELTRLDKAIRIFPARDEAIDAFGA